MSAMQAPEVLVNGVAGGGIAHDDRGLAYGDGLFETLLVRGGRIALWPLHLARLRHGCERLGIAAPDAATLESECEALLAGHADAVLKIVLTRGRGARGYAPSHGAAPTRIVSRHALARLPRSAYVDGVRLRWAETPLATSTALAGIKHLNRLLQVLACAEPGHSAVHDALMCDERGCVLGATSANVFAAIDGVLVTPDVSRAGVAGVCRAALLASLEVVVRDVQAGELARAEEVFLSNAVRGVLPVCAIGDRGYRVGAFAQRAAQALQGRGFEPAMAG